VHPHSRKPAMIPFRCQCGKLLQAREEHAGLQVNCPACGTALLVPGSPGHAVRPAAPPPPAAPQRIAPGAAPARPRAAEGARRPRERRPQAELSGKALASLILGGLTFLLPVLLAVPAVILGLLALRDIGRSGGRRTGKGLALAGITTGAL